MGRRRTNQTAFRTTGGRAPLYRISFEKETVERHKHKSSNYSSDKVVEQEPTVKFGKVILKEFKSTFKAKLQIQCCKNKNCSFSENELSKAFEEIISWCINNDVDNLKRVIDRDNIDHDDVDGESDDDSDDDSDLNSYSIYKHLIYGVDCRDLETGYNIREIVSATGNVETMKLISNAEEEEHIYFGNALEISIIKNDVDMIRCILCITPRYVDNYLSKKDFLIVLKGYIDHKKMDLVQNKDIFIGDMLRSAIEAKNMDALKIFVSNGFDMNGKRHRRDGPPLHTAVRKGDFDIVEFLLNNGASPFLRDDSCNALEIIKYDSKRFSEEEILRLEPITELLLLKMKENRKKIGPSYEAVFSECKLHVNYMLNMDLINMRNSNS